MADVAKAKNVGIRRIIPMIPWAERDEDEDPLITKPRMKVAMMRIGERM